jgi:hypothetical protein
VKAGKAPVKAGRAPVSACRAPEDAGRAPEDAGRAPGDDDGATVYPGRVSAKPGLFKKESRQFEMISLVCIETLLISLFIKSS